MNDMKKKSFCVWHGKLEQTVTIHFSLAQYKVSKQNTWIKTDQ
jgi:hypothetical protein